MTHLTRIISYSHLKEGEVLSMVLGEEAWKLCRK